MAKVYISYNQRDSELAQAVAASLRERGHSITIDIASVSAGSDWRAVLNEALKQSDVFVAILTANSLSSQFVASEIGTARAFAQAAGDMLIVPVVADKMEVPPFVSDLFAVIARDRDVERIAVEIDRAIASFVGQKAAREKKQEAQNAQVHANIAEYVDEAIISLRKNDARDRRAATIWYWVGLAALIAGIVFGFWSLHDVVDASHLSSTVPAASPPQICWR